MKWAIDVSGYDGRRYVNPTGYVYDLPMDWKKARDIGGLSLAIIKSSEGTGYTDGAFRMQWAAAKGILPRMAYHFFRANLNAIAQAQFVKSLLAPDFDPRTDFVILDLETYDGMTGPQILAAAGSWLYEMEKIGTLPLIYTYPGFWNAIGGAAATWAKKYPLGLAQWPLDNWIANTAIQQPPYLFDVPRLADFKAKIVAGTIKPMALKPWDSPAIWQFTSRADTKAVPGHPAVKTACDYNAVYMTIPDLIPPASPAHPSICPTCGQNWPS